MNTDPPTFSATIRLRDADATAALACAFAPGLRAGDTILLSGPIGAGKTHFARSLIQARLAAAGRMEDVPSPTFTLVQSYAADGAEIWHADLYRLTTPDEVFELGLDEAFDTAICLVEWPDRLGSARPAGALDLGFAQAAGDDGARDLTMSSSSPRWRALVSGLLPGFEGETAA